MSEKKTFSKIGLGLVISVVASEIFFALARVVYQVISAAFSGFSDINDLIYNIFNATADSEWLTVFLQAAGNAIWIFVVWLFVRRLPAVRGNAASMDTKSKWNLLLVVFCLCMGLIQFGAIIGQLIHYTFSGLLPAPSYGYGSSDGYTATFLITNFINVCVIAPIGEELLFRKVILDRVRPFGDTVAILFSGITFGMFHQNFMQMFFAAALGVLFAYVRIRTGRLWPAITLHFMLNFVNGVVPLLLDAWSSDTSEQMFNGIIVAFWIIAACLIVGLRKKKPVLNPAPYRFSRPITGGVVLSNAGMILFVILCVGSSLLAAILPGLISFTYG